MRLTPDEARRRFLGVPVARLATVRADGAPRLVPVVFALLDLDGDVLVHAVDQKPKTTTRLARLADIPAEPRVAMLADEYDHDWTRLWWARADARAEVVTDDLVRMAAIEALQVRYRQYVDEPPIGPVVIARVTRWSGWSAS